VEIVERLTNGTSADELGHRESLKEVSCWILAHEVTKVEYAALEGTQSASEPTSREMMALTEPGVSILSQFRAFNETKRRSIVDAVLVQILKEIDEEENWHDPSVYLAQRLLYLSRIDFNATVALICFIRIIEPGRSF
jgi:hypothetical protein